MMTLKKVFPEGFYHSDAGLLITDEFSALANQCMNVWVSKCDSCVHVEARGCHQVSCFIILHLIPLRQGFSSNPERHATRKLQLSSVFALYSAEIPGTVNVLPCLAFYVASGILTWFLMLA